MSLKSLEQEVADFKMKLDNIQVANDKRIVKLELFKAIVFLAVHKGTSNLWGTKHQFSFGTVVCYAKESKNYFQSWDILVTKDGETVFKSWNLSSPEIFKDGWWADKVYEYWRKSAAVEEIANLKTLIANISPLTT